LEATRLLKELKQSDESNSILAKQNQKEWTELVENGAIVASKFYWKITESQLLGLVLKQIEVKFC
jgi:hypothetical protein